MSHQHDNIYGTLFCLVGNALKANNHRFFIDKFNDVFILKGERFGLKQTMR